MLDYVLDLGRLVGIGALIYLLYYKLFLVYYKYFYYTSQGIPSMGIPLPFVGHGLEMKKALDRVKDVKWTVLEEFWHTTLGLKVLPRIFVEFAGRGLIVFSDPDLVQELYFHKN
jgi:cytochrome P450